MKNMDQIRAGNALQAAAEKEFKGKDGGEVVKKVPTLIRDNGLMATMAFALDKNQGMESVLDSVAVHLSHPEIGRLPEEIRTTRAWLDYLSDKASSAQLRDQTTEALAYLSYLRRFAKKD